MSYDGAVYATMLRAGAQRLLRERDHINEVNMFPVPDGDSGTNMLYTLTAASEAAPEGERSVGLVAQKAARAALLSARGNSGIILSQIISGLGRGLKEKDTFTARDLAEGLNHAVELAYRSVAQPVEGTILTVVKAGSQVASKVAEETDDLVDFLDRLATEGRRTLAATPGLLDKLQGAVDAGGLGFCVILEGMRDAARQDSPEEAPAEAAETRGVRVVRGQQVTAPVPAAGARWGYEVVYIVSHPAMSLDAIREHLAHMGDSVLVVGDQETAKVHVHTLDPQAVVDWSAGLGDLEQLAFENMDEQVEEREGR